MGKTIAAIQRVSQIKERREKQFFENRMKDAQLTKKKEARIEISKSIELLVPAAASREAVMHSVIDSARERISSRKRQKEKFLVQDGVSTLENVQS